MRSILCLCLLVVIISACNHSSNNDSARTPDTQSSQQPCIEHDFKQYGFTLKTPCKMEDVSSHSDGDFLVNYGGVLHPDNPEKMVAYQLIVSRLPVGYRDLTQQQLEDKVDEILLKSMSKMKNLKSIRFGYEGYLGYVGETVHNGLGQKGIVFLKDNYTIALTVMTNDNLEAKFNAFTNGFNSIKSTKNASCGKVTSSLSKDQKLSFGYTITAPCELKQYPNQNVDYSYSGAINPDNQETAVVYKVLVSELPMRYSQMGTYDQKQIKSNLLEYLKTKDSHKECKISVKNYMAYLASYSEGGFKVKECMVLTEEHMIELMMLSKKGVSDANFINFVNSLKKK